MLLGGPPSSTPESRCCSSSPGSADEALVAQLAGLGLGPAAAMSPLSPTPGGAQSPASAPPIAAAGHHSPCANGGPAAPVVNGGSRSLTFTTASFAQTKFGSTKLKTSSKRAQRLSPTELGLRREQQHARPQPNAAGNPLGPHDIYGGLAVDAGFGDAAAAAVVASQVAAAAAACPPTSRFAASPFLPAGSLPGHHHPTVSGAAAELGAALQQHLLLAN